MTKQITEAKAIETVKAYCTETFGQDVNVIRATFDGEWLVVVGQPSGPTFGVVVNADGEVTEDALDVEETDDEDMDPSGSR